MYVHIRPKLRKELGRDWPQKVGFRAQWVNSWSPRGPYAVYLVPKTELLLIVGCKQGWPSFESFCPSPSCFFYIEEAFLLRLSAIKERSVPNLSCLHDAGNYEVPAKLRVGMRDNG